jgi:hypothetical protein
MKTCYTCKVEKPLTDFYKEENRHGSYCKSCVIERSLKWKEENPDRVKATRARYIAKHPERKKIPEEVLAKWKLWTPEERRVYSRKWVAENPEKHAEYRRKYKAKKAAKWKAYLDGEDY